MIKFGAAKTNSRRLTLIAVRLLAASLAGVISASSGFAGTSPAQAGEEYCTEVNENWGVHRDVSPALTDLGASVYTRMDGEVTSVSGGLYPGGSNTLPLTHRAAGLVKAGQVVPRAANGSPDPNGRIAFISVGMSNTGMEFGEFQRRAGDEPGLAPELAVVNGAQAGMTAQFWTNPDAPTWVTVTQRLTAAGLTPLQVQVAWVKLVLVGPGEFPEKSQALQTALVEVVQNLRIRFPNIQQAYLSSRTRSYTYWYGLSPEPSAFESGFAVKWLIEAQIAGDPALNYDAARGPVLAPWLAWGPYLWADGVNARSDGLVWTSQDMVPDCTHPSSNGVAKVAQLLLGFFSTQPTTRGWFLAEPIPPPQDFRLYLPGLSSAAQPINLSRPAHVR
jgi:hypothetical protein